MQPWFRSRTGLSWQPTCWQGWAVVVIFIIAVVVTQLLLEDSMLGAILTLAYVLALLAVVFRTGERIRG